MTKKVRKTCWVTVVSRRFNMVMIMWGLVLLLVASAGLAHVAGGLQSLGVIWAYRICATTGGLCEHPDWLVIGAGGIAAAYLLLRRISV